MDTLFFLFFYFLFFTNTTGARGENTGGDFFVENIFEELDYPSEFYHDYVNGKLYLYHNGTGAPSTKNVVAPLQQVWFLK